MKGFPDLLRAFSKELLRDKPTDSYKYSYEYFMNKIETAQIEKEQEEEERKEREGKAGPA